jgi:hypothetical protein
MRERKMGIRRGNWKKIGRGIGNLDRDTDRERDTERERESGEG